MKIIWTNEAIKSLQDIKDYISLDNEKRANDFVNYLIGRSEIIRQNPQIGRVVPEISNYFIRELIVKNYRVVYRIHENIIEILTIFEAHKLLGLSNTE